jgi:TPR repeat protein
MRPPAVSCIAFAVATAAAAVGANCVRPTEAHTPPAQRRTSTDSPLVAIVGTGIDIVRMPPRSSPLPERPPAITPEPPSPPLPGPPQPAPAMGRLLKLPVVIGGLPSDRQKGRLGLVASAVEKPLASALEMPRSQGVLVSETTSGAPARRSGLTLGDIIVSFDGEAVEHMKDLCRRLASATPGREAVLEIWRVAGGDFIETLHRLGDGGNAHIMYRLGKMYATGIGVASDEAKAVDWYRKGVAAGNVHAMTELAGALLEGRGAEKDAPEALRLLRTAADKEQPEAMHRLGILLRDGKATDKNVAEAVQLLTKAGNAGHAPAMVEIGLTYDRGLGVTADAAKAAAWYKKAADLGNPAAVMNLGNLHLQGRGVAKSFVAATASYKKAADLGDTFAMHNMGWMLDKGVGVERRDPDQAADLVLRALASRNQFSYEQMTKNAHNWSPEFRQALQKKLRDAGVFSGPIDGALKASTVAAIDAYISRSPRRDQRHQPCEAGGNVL